MGKKLENFKRANRKLGILIDSIKGLIITLVVFALIVFFGSAIVHNFMKFGEVSSKYSGDYKNLYPVGDSKMMNIYSVGSSEQTIVILPEYGASSPVIKYKALADALSSQYRVVIVEYLGYGYSLSTDKERTSENLINEVRKGLESAEITGPYILMPFTTSNIYANYYAENYPDEVNGIISIDGMYAKEIENTNFKDEYLPNVISNVKFYSAISYSGIFRWASYLKPEVFDIDKMNNNKSYGTAELKVYRNLLANKYLGKAMRNEIYKLEDNMKEIKDYIYPENLTTLQIITSDNQNIYSERNENIEDYAQNMITNEDIQKIRIVDGELSDYLFDSDSIDTIANMISFYF